jgi:hypothetical protein
LEENEARFWHDEMKKTALAADRTVAFVGFYLRRRFDFEHYLAAVASTPVLNE